MCLFQDSLPARENILRQARKNHPVTALTGMDKKSLIAEIIAKCDDVDLKALANDVKPFLTNPEHAGRVGLFKSFIQQKVN